MKTVIRDAEKGKEFLQKKHGIDGSQKILAQAERVFSFLPKEKQDYLIQTGLANDPTLIEDMANIARKAEMKMGGMSDRDTLFKAQSERVVADAKDAAGKALYNLDMRCIETYGPSEGGRHNFFNDDSETYEDPTSHTPFTSGRSKKATDEGYSQDDEGDTGRRDPNTGDPMLNYNSMKGGE